MEHSAIFHDTNKKYCFALEKDTFLIRLKTKKNDLKRVTLHYQDKYLPLKIKDTRKHVEMERFASDSYNDYYQVKLNFHVVCLRYFFELEDYDGAVFFYGNHEFYSEKITNIDYMYDCPQNLREEEMFSTPDWAKHKVVYQIFPSRFATSKLVDKKKWYKAPITSRDDLQGDLRGIIDHLDHLKELGVDVVYMTPIFASPSSHKYNTVDYYQIDPSFGTTSDLKELVEKAHGLGMKVILDGVFNHTDPSFFAFDDIQKNKQKSRFLDWYYIEGFPLRSAFGIIPNYKCFSYFGGMPKVNLQNEEAIDYFLSVGRYWIRECGIDGWRLDVADEISHRFWRRFRKAIKEENPNALIIGEVWHQAEDFLDGEEWDTVMNYAFYYALEDLLVQEKIPVSKFLGQLGYLEGNLHPKVHSILWNLLDSHDTARFLHRCQENVDKFKLGVAIQLLSPGMPFIYYGDEYGMTGGPDPDCRRGMLWDEKRQNQDVYSWYRKLIQLRKAHPVLTEGEITDVFCHDETGVFYITRKHGADELTMLVNTSKDAVEFETLEVEGFEGRLDYITDKIFQGNLEPYQVVVI